MLELASLKSFDMPVRREKCTSKLGVPSRIRPTLLSLLVVAAQLCGSIFAQAQVPGSQPPPARQDVNIVTPNERAAENYDAKGVRVGSFFLFPLMEFDEAFNDNIYATSAATGRTSSFIQILKPSVELRSDWQNHMLNFFARGAFGLYSADSTQNYQDYSVGVNGRLDIQREWNIYGGTSYSRGHEELGTPNTVLGTFQPNFYNQFAANLGYFQQFGLFKARLDTSLDSFDYQNNANGPVQGVILNSDRDRTEFRESLRFGYEFIRGLEVWVRGGLNQRRYVSGMDSLGFDRNSTGWDGVGGLSLDLGGVTSIEVYAGYIQQDYADVRFQSVRAPTFGLTGYWNPVKPLSVRPFVRRTVDDTALAFASGFLSTSGGVDLDYDLSPNVRISGHGDYSIADYQAISNSTNRYDQYVTLRAGVMYYPTASFFVGPSYQYIHRSSNQFNSDYDQNLIMLRLGARL
jgi:hypothetical protein